MNQRLIYCIMSADSATLFPCSSSNDNNKSKSSCSSNNQSCSHMKKERAHTIEASLVSASERAHFFAPEPPLPPPPRESARVPC